MDFNTTYKKLTEDKIQYVISFYQKGSGDHFLGKDGKITSESDNEKKEIENAKKFASIKVAESYFKKHYPEHKNYKIKNDEHHTANWKQYNVAILSTDNFE